MEVMDVQQESAREGYLPLTFVTSRGDVACHYYAVTEPRRAVIWVGGVGGGFDSPANQLYPRLCRDLQGEGVASLRVRYRHPTNLEESLLDVLAGLGWLENEGVEALALVGHSFGGAVVIQAGTASETVRGVVTLAAQGYGADAVAELGPECGLLLLHGTADTVLPPEGSRLIYQMAHEPRRLILYDGAGHSLDEAADEVERTVRAYLLERLA
ncbi:MAG: dienelactone hydrolase family protein [Ktedonobacterales bacterium]|nr:dienelactone hydrolase family protein [Ktedonobacterales bacterium]